MALSTLLSLCLPVSFIYFAHMLLKLEYAEETTKHLQAFISEKTKTKNKVAFEVSFAACAEPHKLLKY